MQALRMNVQGYLSSATKNPLRASRNALLTIVTILVLWKYLVLFMGMSVEMSKGIKRNAEKRRELKGTR